MRCLVNMNYIVSAAFMSTVSRSPSYSLYDAIIYQYNTIARLYAVPQTETIATTS
jgi:hypothetical protein